MKSAKNRNIPETPCSSFIWKQDGSASSFSYLPLDFFNQDSSMFKRQ